MGFYRVKQPELFCPDRLAQDVWFTFGCIWVNSCWNRNVFSVLVAYDIVSAMVTIPQYWTAAISESGTRVFIDMDILKCVFFLQSSIL